MSILIVLSVIRVSHYMIRSYYYVHNHVVLRYTVLVKYRQPLSLLTSHKSSLGSREKMLLLGC
jgi:hypothetical protein